MSQLLNGIEGVIFDFGQVLIELDYPKVIDGFSKVAHKNKEEINELVVTAPLLKEFEVGNISPNEFRLGVNELLGTSLDDVLLDEIWNSMLKNLPKNRMDILASVGKKFKTYILSNTNVIHEAFYNKMIFEVTGEPSLHQLVNKAYCSQDMGLRKPNKACYEYVIDDIGVDPGKLLFLDDRSDNIEGASKCGLRTIHVTNADTQLRELLNNG
jgi:putative hydrolase of the HAD superfamily